MFVNRHAKVWTLNKDDRDKVHEKANSCQRKFIYLPLHILEQATNVPKLIKEQAILHKQKLEFLDHYIKSMWEKIYMLQHWHPFMFDFKFNDDTEANEQESEDLIIITTECDPVIDDRPNASEKSFGSARKNENAKNNSSTKSPTKSPTKSHDKSTCSSKSDECSTGNSSTHDIRIENTETVQQSLNANHSKSTQSENNQTSNDSNVEANEFQMEVMAMDYDTFVKQTNISELVEQDYRKQKGDKTFTQENLEFGLKFYYNFKNKKNSWKKWSANSLKFLKYKHCKCRRNKAFISFSTQTNQPASKCEISVQCDEKEINNSLHPKSPLNNGQASRLAALSIHHISQSDTIVVYSEADATENASESITDSENSKYI